MSSTSSLQTRQEPGQMLTKRRTTPNLEQQRKESNVCGVMLIIPEASSFFFFFLMFPRLFLLSLSLLSHAGKLQCFRQELAGLSHTCISTFKWDLASPFPLCPALAIYHIHTILCSLSTQHPSPSSFFFDVSSSSSLVCLFQNMVFLYSHDLSWNSFLELSRPG